MSVARRRVQHDAAVLDHDDAIGMGERQRDVVHGEDRSLVPRDQLAEHLGALHAVERRRPARRR